MQRRPRGHGPRGYTASNSFSEAEVNALDTLLSIMLRGGDPKIVARSTAVHTLAQKFSRMKVSIERSKHIQSQTEKATREGVECTCEDAMAERFDANPTGHYVSCPLWGTTHANKHSGGAPLVMGDSAVADTEAERDAAARASNLAPHLSTSAYNDETEAAYDAFSRAAYAGRTE